MHFTCVACVCVVKMRLYNHVMNYDFIFDINLVFFLLFHALMAVNHL